MRIPGSAGTAAVLFVMILCLAGRAAGQQVPRRAAPADTTVAPDTLGPSARGALLRSFAIPGWGQAYAGSPGRGAIYFAMEAGSLWMVLKTRQQLSAARTRDAWLREEQRLAEGEISQTTRSRAQQFEDWTTLAVFVALFAGADAYVSAQLADFGEHIGVRPGVGTLQIQAALPTGARR